ncbi:antiterminator LoaP [Enterocloster clostridioformis]|uniref:antiterminator LoaP n=1 Tax=Enterocloster clostridioformis TaxID=1531 RepID=UPI001570BF8D|nr:antiterminator LoaP [Enterocloster clostridioformis]NSJ55772.1 antiterminator LoaP [Enterocloster clostridioformis]
MENWYAVQVRTGREESVVFQSKSIIDRAVLNECFIPRYERMKRYHGEWHKEKHALFPGYVFFVTEKVDELFRELKKLPEFTKILGDGMEFIPLKEKERGFLQEMADREHIIQMSEGYIVGDKVIIISGPMKEIKGEIIYVDRHKRLAVVRMEMFGRQMDVKMGVEIVSKIQAFS